MKKIFAILVLLSLLIRNDCQAQTTVYLPIILSDGKQIMEYPLLSISNGTDTINLLDPGSGLQMDNPYWQPNIAQLKGGGTFVNPSNANGQALVSANYDNVIETIPLRITGPEGYKTVENLRRVFQMSVNAQNYYTASFEQNQVYMAVKAKGDNFLTGYASIYTISMTNISNPYGAPFVNDIDYNQFDTVNLVINREPFYSPVIPGQIIGPLYNLIENPDFEIWNFGIGDSQPDNWDDLEDGTTGTNNRWSNSKWGNFSLQVAVTESVGAGEYKGVTQILNDIEDGTEYTVLAWVKNDGIIKGIGRILINYSDQLVLYSSATKHDWTLYTGKITTGSSDTVSVNLEILTTDSHTIGNVYFDGLMFIKGDWIEEAENNMIPYMSSSHIVNHLEKQTGNLVAGNINYVDGWNIPGDVDSLIRLEFKNINDYADETNPVEIYKTIRIGLRRTGDVLQLTNYHDPAGLFDDTTSSDDYVDSGPLSDIPLNIATNIISSTENVRNNAGRYKAFARVKDTKTITPSLETNLRYFVGESGIHDVVMAKITPNILDWTILDLTKYEDLNYDFKNFNEIGQIGYKLYMTRQDTTDEGYLDYVLLMPTDGGFVNATINPALIKNSILVADNTKSASNVKASYTLGWSLLFDPTDVAGFEVYGIEEYNGDIYFNTNRKFYRLRNNNITDITPSFLDANALSSVIGFGKFNGKLFIISTRYADDEFDLYSSTDGNNWTLLGTEGIFGPRGTLKGGAFIAYNNKLFFVMSRTAFFDTEAFTWDGSNLVSNYTFPNSPGSRASRFAIYQDNLYITIEDDLWVYDVAGDTWNIAYATIPQTSVGSSFLDMEVYDNKLWIGGISLMSWDGTNWTEHLSLPSYFAVINTLEVFNNKLYIGGEDTGGDGVAMIYTTDGTTFGADTITAVNVYYLLNANGVFYALGADPDGDVKGYVYSDSDVSYPITDFEGSLFLAPPRIPSDSKRHRYIFSYDREGYINKIDDKALIGIGYRPQYFSLINKDDF